MIATTKFASVPGLATAATAVCAVPAPYDSTLELLFVSPPATMVAAVSDPLLATQIRVGDSRPYAVDKSGQRFLLKVGPEPQTVAVMD